MKERKVILSSENLVYEDDEIGSYEYSDGTLCYSRNAQMRWSYAVYAGPANNEIEGAIDIPSKVTICDQEFKVVGITSFCECNKITSLYIPKSVVEIKGEGIFSGCDNLESIIIDKDNPFIDSRDDCNAIIYTRENWLISGCKNTIIPLSVTLIRDFAFENCHCLPSIVFPDSVQTIGNYAFYGCSALKTINIPENVSSIGKGAFQGCSGLNSLAVSNNNRVYDSRKNCNAIIETDSNILVAGCMNTIIPESVTEIEEGTFADNIFLKNIELPDSIVSIGEKSFSNSGLVSIIIPKSIEHIDNNAFSGCKQLKQISVDKENAIFDSRNNCNAIIETASNKLLYGCKNTIIPPNVSIIGEAAFLENEEIASIVIPEGIESIEPYAFYGCKNLKSIYSYVKDPTACFIHVSAFFEHGENAVLYVPKGTADVYRNAQDGWLIFNDIQEFNTKHGNTF